MFTSIFSDTSKFIGQCIGEAVHQTAELAEGTYNVTKAVAEDISNIPSAIMQGYEEELFEAKSTDETKNNSIIIDSNESME